METRKQGGSSQDNENRKRSRDDDEMGKGNVMNDGGNEEECGRGRKKVKRDNRMEVGYLVNERDVEVRLPCPYDNGSCGDFACNESRGLRGHVSNGHRELGEHLCWRCNKVCESAEILIDHVMLRHAEDESQYRLHVREGKVCRSGLRSKREVVKTKMADI